MLSAWKLVDEEINLLLEILEESFQWRTSCPAKLNDRTFRAACYHFPADVARRRADFLINSSPTGENPHIVYPART